MPNYIKSMLKKFGHIKKSRPQHSPYPFTKFQFGKQKPEPNIEYPPLTKEKTTRIQQIVGSALFYARAIDSTMLMALNTIALEQSKATEKQPLI